MTIHVERKGTLLHILLAAGVLLAIALAVFLTAITRATDISWAGSSDPTLTYETKTPPSLSVPRIFGCTDQKIAVDGYFPSVDACVTTGKSIKLAVYHNPNNGNDLLAISYLSDTSFYKLSNVSFTSYSMNPVLIPGTDILYVMMPNGSLARSLSVFKPFPSKLSKTLSVIDHTEYMWDIENPDFVVKDEHGTKLNLNAVTHSPGGRWIVTEMRGAGLIRVDTNDLSAEVISRYYRNYGVGNDPVMSLAVTADGQHVAVGGTNAGLMAIDVPDSCGDPVVSATFSANYTIPHPCPERDYYGFVISRVDYQNGLPWAYDLNFSDDGGQLTFYFGAATWQRFVTMTAPGYIPSQLDYLALGDSMSSGEGDTETHPTTGNKYYRPYTDNEENLSAGQPREKCHISTRSYPYRLAQFMNLAQDDPKQWNSIACSGAGMGDIGGNNVDYQGQARGGFGPLDKMPRLDVYDYDSLKAAALNEMIPGRNTQIEFVKKYKPKVITLTVGANDIGFDGKLRSCVEKTDTCYSAQLQGKKDLAKEIKKQFPKLVEHYRQLYESSDDKAKVYVMGYSQFINDDIAAICERNILYLDAQEKEMITNATSYMNDVIEAAAKSAGVKYVDIEDAFMPDSGQDPAGHRLCDSGTKYITGAAFWDKSEVQESFHPNDLGHIRLSSRIKSKLNNQSLLDYDICDNTDANLCPNPIVTAAPPIPSYFGTESDINVRSNALQISRAVKNVQTTVTSPQFLVKAGSSIIQMLFSEPVDLGQATANADGSLASTITIPSSVQPGFHTLVLTGESYSGEPLRITQVIEVVGADPNDIDEDGVVDSTDKCFYITPSNFDADSDGVDDACDAIIGEPKEAYRIRSGVVANGEQANYLYVERNVNATTLTGISGDYDPDHNGWAVVAASQNTAQAGPYAKFWITGNDGSKVPHVSLRTAENGCVQYKPANLSKVVDSSPQTLTQEAMDTNTCRSEPVAADLDSNGQPDNTQPLYRARNGITANGEDSRKLYLERSTRAAEAQLGKSDYAANETPSTGPTDTVDHRKAWSRLATSSPGLIVDNYKKVVFINNQPYVLAANFLSQCYAYKSQSLATIKQSTQNIRQLQIDWAQTLVQQLQGGCNG